MQIFTPFWAILQEMRQVAVDVAKILPPIHGIQAKFVYYFAKIYEHFAERPYPQKTRCKRNE
ncbi:MAG: hypothetical protein KC449_02590 [Anaerolineales bacterium]|nr:hypothetical protein [Anaerolineales bacterium]